MNSDIADSKLAPLETHDLQIGGTRSKPSSGLYFQTDNPCSGEVWANVARGSKADVDRAVEAAAAALPVWNRMRPAERGMRMMRLADLVERDAQRLATLEVRDNGKLYAEMFAQVRLVADWFRYYGGLADKLEGAVIPTGKPDMFTFTRYEPLGVVALITPWNSPLLLLTHKLATALAAGNVAVIKPSEHASVSTLVFAELFTEAGFPARRDQRRDRLRARSGRRTDVAIRSSPKSPSPARKAAASASTKLRRGISSMSPSSSAANRPTSCSTMPTCRLP